MILADKDKDDHEMTVALWLNDVLQAPELRSIAHKEGVTTKTTRSKRNVASHRAARPTSPQRAYSGPRGARRMLGICCGQIALPAHGCDMERGCVTLGSPESRPIGNASDGLVFIDAA